MDDILSQIIAYAPDRIDTETKAQALAIGPRAMVGEITDEQTQFGRPIYQTPAGEKVSEKSTTLFFNGNWMNVPSIHGGKSFNEDELRLMIKQGNLQPTSVHKSKDDAETAAKARSDSMVQGPRNMYSGGGLARALILLKNFNKTGAVKGLEENLIKKYKSQGMEFLDAIKKAQTEAGGVRYEGKIKIIDNAMKETNVMSDDYVDLLDMKIKLEDPDFAKQYVKFSENLKNKTRSRYDSDWAEANFGEEYGTKLDQARVREINESIDPNITERSLVDDIDDMNIANTDEFFGRKKNAAGGLQRNMYNQGQLVQPNADGSRPGYSGLPDFITKSGSKINPYRVKVKKSKLNEPFSGMYPTLKKAKEVVKEKRFKKGKTGVEYPELLEKAKNVANDFNEIVDSAITNNDLRDVKYLETYVKDRFKNKSEQDQVLRQIYKNKIPYRDLTKVRKKVAGNLVNEAMKVDEIVPNQFVYDRLGADASRKLSVDVQQLVSDGLKNQTKIKVDRAISSVVDGDMIIDDSLKKTVGNIIGRSQFGNKAGSAWKQAFNENKFYKKNKKLLDYAFTAGAKSSRTPGLSIQEILDDAKYKIDGGVTFSGKNTQFSGLKRYMFDYAKQHWHRNNYNGTPEKSLIEFYDKNGKPIKWKSGLKLNIGEVQFKIPSESDVMWSYNGKPKGSVSVTGPVADASGIFNEVTDQYNVIKEISDAPVTNPITGKKTNYNDLVKQIYKQYGYTGQNVFGLDIDHFKGVVDHPFRNLRAMDRRLNISLGAIDRTFDNKNLKSKLKKELLGNLSTGTGSNYSKNLKNYFVNQASTVLEKGATETLATKSPYYQAVKNVYEQKNLPKTQKDLLEKSYQRATKLEKDLLEYAGTITDKCKIGKAGGGRIGFASGSADCLRIAKEGLEKNLFKGGGTEVQRGLIQKIISGGGKMALSMLNPKELIRLSNLVGPGALGLMGLYEAGSITDDVLRLNKPFDEALAGNWLTKSFLPYSEEFAKQKNLLQSGQLAGDQKEYALEMMKMENFVKEGQRIEGMAATKLLDNSDYGNIDGSPMVSKEDMNKAYAGMFGRLMRMKPYMFEEGITGRSLENEAAMNEYQDSRLAKTGKYTSAISEDKFRLPGQRQIKQDENYEFASSPIFGGPQPMVNKAPRPKNMGRGPMTEKNRMNLDLSIPGYTPYDKTYTPTDEETLQIYRNQGIVPPTTGYLAPGEGTKFRMGLASQGGNRSIYGSKFMEGGIASLNVKK